MSERSIFLKDEQAQLDLAAVIASHTPPGSIIFLQGDLGAGKTTLARGFLQALGHRGNVKSPTYTLVEPYLINQQQVYHFDLYRLGSPDELEYAGGRDYFDNESISLIEWPEKAAGYLPVADISCCLSYQKQSGAQGVIQGRQCVISSKTQKGQHIIQLISHQLD
ncbi:tRNA threonylcarbamoyladenosine biosynthesis protein TsaE [hydrothermal vent metagenome]|uniref:tRNA threonylcarbamoyladenosine biosynthesis protein TsaE n=1 Tax=hydrothermal vent metagenome TaxID=652676 RepID=A0A3B0XGK2_9ZZZZ